MFLRRLRQPKLVLLVVQTNVIGMSTSRTSVIIPGSEAPRLALPGT
jgi:hypothetical protein